MSRSTAPKLQVPRWTTSTVGEAMHCGVITCLQSAAAVVVARIMAAHRIHCVVIVDSHGQCVAVVGDADVAAAAHDDTLELMTARELGQPPVLVEPTADLRTAVALMRRHAVTHLVVAAPQSSLPLGVLSVLDVVDHM